MKTTLDLPADLLRQIKLRALNEGRKIKDVTADLLHIGLGQTPPSQLPKPQKSPIDTLPNGLPVVRCNPAASASTMTADELVALSSEAETQEDKKRLGHTL